MVAAAGVIGVVTAVSTDLAGAGRRAAPASAARIGAVSPAAGSAGSAAGSAESREEKAHDDEMTTPSRPTVVSVGRSRVGSVLVGDAGMTLYVFSADKPGVSSCTGACARSWVPAGSHGGKPRAGASLPAATIGAILRGDGSYQITLWRQPLYYYAGDHKPGDANGQGRTGFGGTWRVADLREKS